MKWIVFTFKRTFLLRLKKIECRIKTYLLNRSAKKAFKYKESAFKRIVASVRERGWLFIVIFITLTISITWANTRFSLTIGNINTIKTEKRIIMPEEKNNIIKNTSVEPHPQPPSTNKIGPRIKEDILEDFFKEDDIEFAILVDKTKKELLVVQNLERYLKVVERFPVSLGKSPGNKKREGDMKTPEGKYKIINIKKDAELLPRYGPMAFVLNYPNETDMAMGKTGSGIWIHGTEGEKITPDTKGCVEINNANLMKLAEYAGNGTPVIILPEESNIWE